MERKTTDQAAESRVETGARKPYRKPRILTSEMLEVVAATCGDSKAQVGDGVCGVFFPVNS